MLRHRPPTLDTTIDAVLGCPLIHDLGAAVPRPSVGRVARHPAALHLAWAALARAVGSGNRLDAEIAAGGLWDRILTRYNTAARAHPAGEPATTNLDRLYADTHRHTRDRFCRDELLAHLCAEFTRHSTTLAGTVGLLDPTTAGSRTRPDPTATIYGDGTVLRPIYRGDPGHRTDRDAQAHHRHDGTIVGTKLVHLAVRGPEPHRRVMLAVGHVTDPGREADTAVELIRRVHHHAPGGVTAVVYDGAFRGVHHETLMTELGLLVINKPHGTRSKKPRTLPLGTWTHTTRGGDCHHTLVAHGGDVCDATPDDAGRPTRSEPLARVQVRRTDRPRGGYRFALGVRVPCTAGAFTAWISPHPGPGDTSTGRADQLRLISPHEDLFATLYGLRNDSEAINSAYKRTHIHDRSPVLGWRRTLLDLLAWSILNNATAWWHHAQNARGLRTAA